MSLVEALIALALLGSSLVLILNSFAVLTRLNARSQTQSSAATVARTTLERLRAEDPSSLPSTGSASESVFFGNETFTVTTSFCNNPDYCDANTRHVAVAVLKAGQDVFRAETVLAQLR